MFVYVFEYVDQSEQSLEQIPNSSITDLEDGITYQNQDEAIGMIEESPVAAEMTMIQSNEANMWCLAGAYGIQLALLKFIIELSQIPTQFFSSREIAQEHWDAYCILITEPCSVYLLHLFWDLVLKRLIL